MKPTNYLLKPLAGLFGLTTLLSMTSKAATTLPTYWDERMPEQIVIENGISDGAIAESETFNKVPGARYVFRVGMLAVPPAEVPATDSKGVLVKTGPAKGGMAPCAANDTWEVFGTVYWLHKTSDWQYSFPTLSLIVPKSETDMYGGQVGARYKINPDLSVGGMVGYDESTTAMMFPNGFHFATVSSASWAFSPFLAYDKKGMVGGADFGAALVYSHALTSYDLRRLPNDFGSTNGTSNVAELTTGLTWHAGALNHGPTLGLRWVEGHTDAFRDFGTLPNLVYSRFGFRSLASELGYQLSYDIAVGCGKIVPTAGAIWEHEFQPDYATVAGLPNGTRAKDTAVLEAGIGWYGTSGWNVVLDYEARLNSQSASNFVALKVGKSF